MLNYVTQSWESTLLPTHDKHDITHWHGLPSQYDHAHDSDSDHNDVHFHKLEGYEKESEILVVCIIIRVWCVINSGGFGVAIQGRFVMNTLKYQRNLAYSV